MLNRDGELGLATPGASTSGLTANRRHLFKAMGFYVLPIGKHSLNLGGTLFVRSGLPWGYVTTETYTVGSRDFDLVKYLEPTGERRLTGHYYINLTAAWRFPIAGSVEGELRAEVSNATNEQEQLNVDRYTGEPVPDEGSWQRPRTIRLVAGVRF
jgi:hypothetical protein